MATPKISIELINYAELPANEETGQPTPWPTPWGEPMLPEHIIDTEEDPVIVFSDVVANGAPSAPVRLAIWNNKSGLTDVLTMKDCYFSVVNRYGTNGSLSTSPNGYELDPYVQAMGNNNPTKRWFWSRCDSKDTTTYAQVGSLFPASIKAGALPISAFGTTDNSLSGKANNGQLIPTVILPGEGAEEGTPPLVLPPGGLNNCAVVTTRVQVSPSGFGTPVNLSCFFWIGYQID